MPFESTLPLVVFCLLGAAVAFVAWLRMRERGWIITTALLALAGFGLLLADLFVQTDREHLLAMFPLLARAAEKQDVATLMAAVDPELLPLRDEAARVLKQMRPTEVVITRNDVVVDPSTNPPQAVAELIVRVTGNVIDKATPSAVLVGMKVLLRKNDGRWLVQDAEAEQVRPGRRN